MNEKWRVCDSGHNQSPIRITQSRQDALIFPTDYHPFPIAMQNTGHDLKVYALADVRRTGSRWKLVQFHFHVPAEHIIGTGQPAAGELHLVHENDDNDLLVIAVLIQRQQNDNPGLTPLVANVPAACTSVKADSYSGISDLLPRERNAFYFYAGSLTTPPCTQSVIFYVMRDPIGASDDQLSKLAITPLPRGNARPPQPMGAERQALVRRSFP